MIRFPRDHIQYTQWPNAGIMLAHHQWRWSSIGSCVSWVVCSCVNPICWSENVVCPQGYNPAPSLFTVGPTSGTVAQHSYRFGPSLSSCTISPEATDALVWRPWRWPSIDVDMGHHCEAVLFPQKQQMRWFGLLKADSCAHHQVTCK